MATFSKFEDIQVWQKARNLSGQIYEITSNGRFSKDFGLRDQIRRSCVSVMANIAEGQGRRSDKDFANFLNISLGSIAETKSHLYLALDLGYLEKAAFDEIYAKLDEVGRMTFALCMHLRSGTTSETSKTSKTSKTKKDGSNKSKQNKSKNERQEESCGSKDRCRSKKTSG